ncbi:MAG: thioredoxin domain-containing protein [Thermoanaerobaculales bacterium]
MTNASSLESPVAKSSQGSNHLAGEKSPYLLQHADNPVDWYPWGEEAFAKAKREGKPIFLSIGYATCHWCHVMEHESFEDPTVAGLMNDAFINIKVDREERPDIDQVYMTVCQMLTGGGGWPLTIIMSPDKQPFYAATYIPKESRFGRIGMLDLAPRVRELWRNDREKAIDNAQKILAGLQTLDDRQTSGHLAPAAVDAAYQELAGRYDASHGGFGAAPKFPSAHNLVFLTRYWQRTGNQRALDMVEHTLEQMRLGGIYDQIGFGFHRYSTDAEWLVPHFEKMLYDQAMLTMAYTEAWLATGNPIFERTVREIIEYVERDMTAPEGGFYSAEDADSEGEEGLFYLWTVTDIAEVLGKDDAAFAATVWSLSKEGNFHDEVVGERTGRNIPHVTQTHAGTAKDPGTSARDFDKRVERARAQLFAAREQRIHPLKDDKILADWNGLMAAAMARAGRAFDEPEWVKAARKSTAFILSTMRSKEGRLLHRFRDGEASIPAFLDDHVFLTTAMLDLYDATLEAEYLGKAMELQAQTTNLFWDAPRGGLFFTATDSEELLIRQKEIYDGAIPSGNSMAAENLIRLTRLTGDPEFAREADSIFEAFAAEATSMPSAHTQLMIANQLAAGPSLEVVIVGDPGARDTRALLQTVRADYLPHAAVLLVPPGSSGKAVHRLAPFTEPYTQVDDRATAYVCRDFQCRLPTTEPKKLADLLREAVSKPESSE